MPWRASPCLLVNWVHKPTRCASTHVLGDARARAPASCTAQVWSIALRNAKVEGDATDVRQVKIATGSGFIYLRAQDEVTGPARTHAWRVACAACVRVCGLAHRVRAPLRPCCGGTQACMHACMHASVAWGVHVGCGVGCARHACTPSVSAQACAEGICKLAFCTPGTDHILHCTWHEYTDRGILLHIILHTAYRILHTAYRIPHTA